MDRSLLYQMTDDFALDVQSHRQLLGDPYKAFLIVGVFGGLVLWGLHFRRILPVSLLMVLAIFAAAWLVANHQYELWQQRRATRKRLAELPDRLVTIRLNDAELRYEWSRGHLIFPWTTLRQIYCRATFWTLHFGDEGCVIPVDCLDEELAQFLRLKVREQGKTIARDKVNLTNFDGPLLSRDS